MQKQIYINFSVEKCFKNDGDKKDTKISLQNFYCFLNQKKKTDEEEKIINFFSLLFFGNGCADTHTLAHTCICKTTLKAAGNDDDDVSISNDETTTMTK